MRAVQGRWSSWMIVVLGLGFLRACSLETQPPPPGPCTDDPAVCDDGDACTDDLCAPDGYCTHESADLAPDDGNPCTLDECTGGQEQHTSLPDGAGCGLNDLLVCEGGKCKCTSSAECGVDTPCIAFACEADACVTVKAPKDTPVDGAGDGDCAQAVCDGAGQTTLIPDLADPPADPSPGDCRTKACADDGSVLDADAPDDAPADDGNPCTIEGCSAGTPIAHQPVADGTSCGSPASCGPAQPGFAQTSAEVCQGGSCMTATLTSCGLYVCGGDTCLAACASNDQCVSGAFCQGGLCQPQVGLGNPCLEDADCTSGHCLDGVCCNTGCDGLCQKCDLQGSVGVCGNVPSGTDPDDECAGTQTCSGAGGCTKLAGDTCAGDAECVTGQCEDGICCSTDCAGACRRCDLAGNLGTCTDVPSGQSVAGCDGGLACNGDNACKKLNGQTCNTQSECLSGFCPIESGAPDVCCDTSCSGKCRSCLGSRTGGVDGTCDFILPKTDPNDDCTGICSMVSGDNCCDGMGMCQD